MTTPRGRNILCWSSCFPCPSASSPKAANGGLRGPTPLVPHRSHMAGGILQTWLGGSPLVGGSRKRVGCALCGSPIYFLTSCSSFDTLLVLFCYPTEVDPRKTHPHRFLGMGASFFLRKFSKGPRLGHFRKTVSSSLVVEDQRGATHVKVGQTGGDPPERNRLECPKNLEPFNRHPLENPMLSIGKSKPVEVGGGGGIVAFGSLALLIGPVFSTRPCKAISLHFWGQPGQARRVFSAQPARPSKAQRFPTHRTTEPTQDRPLTF